MVAKRLRVATDEDATPKEPLTLVQAIESGDYREILLAQRREIATSLPDERGPAKAALHRQLSLISKELETLAAADLNGIDSVVADTSDDAWDADAI